MKDYNEIYYCKGRQTFMFIVRIILIADMLHLDNDN